MSSLEFTVTFIVGLVYLSSDVAQDWGKGLITAVARSTTRSHPSSDWVSHNVGHIFVEFLELEEGHTPEELVRLVYYSYFLMQTS